MKRLDLVVGPNGAGKSTFVAFVLAPALPGSAFVNADLIAAQRWPGSESAHAYDAAKVAAETRARLIEAGTSFIAETVFSHPSKRDLIINARGAGYVVVLHVLLVPEEIAVARVAHRVRAGGHEVPEEKIRQRYQRVWPNVATAIRLVDEASVYDSSRDPSPTRVARFSSDQTIGATSWPAWTPAPLLAL